MDKIKKSLSELTNSINIFKKEYKLHYPTDPMSNIWSIKDILCHITYWHRYYAKNLSAQIRGKSYLLPKIQYYVLNQNGVEELRKYSEDNLFKKLNEAHNKLKSVILSGKIKQMTYRESSKPYDILKFLFIVNRHIQAHTRGVMKKRKIK